MLETQRVLLSLSEAFAKRHLPVETRLFALLCFAWTAAGGGPPEKKRPLPVVAAERCGTLELNLGFGGAARPEKEIPSRCRQRGVVP